MKKFQLLSLLFLGFLAMVFWRVSVMEKTMDAEDYLRLGIEKGSQGMHDEAINLFKQALTINPDLVPAYLALGNAYGNTRNYKNSINAYKEGIQLNPHHKDVPRMEMNIAWISHVAHDDETAILYTKKAIQSYTDRNDYKGVAEAGFRLRMFENKK